MNQVVPPAVPLGKQVRARRLELGISQADAAHLAQIDNSNFGKIERGQQAPNINTITRIANALNTTVAELTQDITAENLTPAERQLTARDLLEARAAGKNPLPQTRWH